VAQISGHATISGSFIGICLPLRVLGCWTWHAVQRMFRILKTGELCYWRHVRSRRRLGRC
jgi:hypothetical protein